MGCNRRDDDGDEDGDEDGTVNQAASWTTNAVVCARTNDAPNMATIMVNRNTWDITQKPWNGRSFVSFLLFSFFSFEQKTHARKREKKVL